MRNKTLGIFGAAVVAVFAATVTIPANADSGGSGTAIVGTSHASNFVSRAYVRSRLYDAGYTKIYGTTLRRGYLPASDTVVYYYLSIAHKYGIRYFVVSNAYTGKFVLRKYAP